MVKVMKTCSKSVNVITHPAPHHADEVFAVAMLSFVLKDVRVFRTRDPEKIKKANKNIIICDVGGKYDSDNNKFDHHQADFNETRPDGTLYAAAGLIWRKYGDTIVTKVYPVDQATAIEIAEAIDNNFVKYIDSNDNGQSNSGDKTSISAIISSFNPMWDRNENPNLLFERAVRFARDVLRRTIESTASQIRGSRSVAELLNNYSSNDPILILDKPIGGWLESVLNSKNPVVKGLLYCVFQSEENNWCIRAIPPDTANPMQQRKPFPTPWRGLRGSELVEISGVETAKFCHRSGFFAAASTKDDAIKLAKLSVEF